MADDSDLFDAIPPSPVATSTQIPQSVTGAGFFPPLPQFPSLTDDGAGIPRGPGIGHLEISPIPGSRQVQRSQPARQSSRSSRRTSGGLLENWVARSATVTQQPSAASATASQQHAVIQVEDEIVEIDDNSNSGSTISSSSSVTLGRDTPIQEIVVDSDTNSSTSNGELEERPNTPEPIDVVHVIETDEPVVEDVAREETIGANEPAVIEQGEPAVSGSHGDGAPAATGSTSTDVSQSGSRTPLPALPVQSRLVRSITDSSPADFRSPKRRRVASPEKPVDKGAGDVGDDEEEGECCPICFESWTTSGNHRLSSLKCGHLFGQSCIEKWLRGQGGKCPQCNAKAKRQDIRVLYAKTIKAVDTTEKEQALRDLDKERELRRKAEMDGAQLRLQYQVAIEENNKMRLELETIKSQLRRAGSGLVPSASTSKPTDMKVTGQVQISGQFALDRTIKIWEAGNCRVMAYSPSLATLVVSQPSSSPLFPGFGVKKISALDFKTSQYLTIHSKAIRDVAFHPSVEDGMLLTCGLDRKVKMTSLISNAVVQSYDTPMPAWSCVWNADNRNYMYAGLINGKVLEFDIRNTDSAVSELNKEGSRSPVASLLYMNADQSADFRPGGLLVGQMDRVSFYEKTSGGEWRPHLLPLDGLLTSLSIEPHTRHILASYRPTAKYPTVRHLLCEMFTQNISSDPTVIDNVCSCNIVHTFHGGRTQTVLSRSLVLPHPGDNNRLLVCGGDETNNSVHMWDSGTGQMTQRLLTGGMALDLCSFRIHNSIYLAALTDKQCKMYKWT